MKVGLLVCDHVNEKYQEEFGDYPNMFAALFPEFEIVPFDVVNNEFPVDLEEYTAFMATGSRHSVYEELEWIQRTKDFIKMLYESGKPFVGCCFGHQLMGEALGGKVEKSFNGWCVGVHEFQPIGLNLLMMCQDQIVELPTEAIVLGGNAVCPNGMIQVGQHFLGIQAHPEFSKAYDKMFMETRVDRMGEFVVGRGIASLEQPVHTKEIHAYILNFIKKAMT